MVYDYTCKADIERSIMKKGLVKLYSCLGNEGASRSYMTLKWKNKVLKKVTFLYAGCHLRFNANGG